ncbi:hypothetical protein HMPREF3188_01415 [Tissierellia bacterium KA00581]|nr:hypothetical protein HMPREF3188_01415 [Tissierellia bacterium KA00581]
MVKKRLEMLVTSLIIIVLTVGICFATVSLSKFGKNSSSNSYAQTKNKKSDDEKNEDVNTGNELKDGEYEGTARGYISYITVRVTIKDGKIADIKVIQEDETPEYFNEAVKVLNSIISANSTDVDSISGATVSSDALKEAVEDALQKAGKKTSSIHKSTRSSRTNGSFSPSLARSGGLSSLGSTFVRIPVGGRLKDGTYQGSAPGYRGNIRVSVTVSDGKIAKVDILGYDDDDAYFSSAVGVINQMIGQTSGNVDSVSGATYSSVGIMNAVNNALNKAIEGAPIDNKPYPQEKQKQQENPQQEKPNSKPEQPKPVPKPENPKSGKLKDGTYQGSAKGYRGNITVSVKISNGKISSVYVTKNEEDTAYLNSALGVINKMIGKSSGTVDSVSGATYSSVGIMNAVNNAINKAIDDATGKIPEIKPLPDPKIEEKPTPEPKIKEDKSLQDKIRGDLAEGVFAGEGYGYNTGRGTVKTEVKIENGKIIDITRDEENYPDDGDEYRTRSRNIIKFLKDSVNGKRNIAIMKMHMDLVDQICNSTDKVAKARELIGDAGANYIKNNMNNSFFPLRGYVSIAVKMYLSPKYDAKAMYDAVSGATLSAGGTAVSVDTALAKSESDKKTNSNVDQIEILENKDALIEKNYYTKKIEILSNKSDALDLKDLKVKIKYKDGKEKIVAYKDFAKYGLEITSKDGREIVDNMNFSDEIKNKIVLNVTITHKDSKRYADFAIKFGNYSKDYIVKMQYSLDEGKTWIDIDNPTKSEENKNNIADKQSIKVTKDYIGKSIQVKTTSVKGNTYIYKSDVKGVQFDRIKLSCVDNSYDKNNNASFAVFLVISEDKTSKVKPGHENIPQGPEEEASENDVYVTFAQKNLNHQNFDDVTIKTSDGVKIISVDGLPNGLKLDGNKIVGKIEINDDVFTSSYKEMDVTIHAIKSNKKIKRTVKISVYQDKDRDGIDDNDDAMPDAFNPEFKKTDFEGKCIHGFISNAEPTIEEYKKLFKNIPDDDSVTIEIIRHPDMSKNMSIAKLKFTSKHVSGSSTISVAVKLKAKPKQDPKALLEKTIQQFTVQSFLKNGTFEGKGVGFDLSRGMLNTIVTIENNTVSKVVFEEGSGYSGEQYMDMASKAITYLQGPDAKRNVAILRTHKNYVDQIVALGDDINARKKKAQELIGKEYADKIKDIRRPEDISPLVREFISANVQDTAKSTMDSVTGATLTAGGLGESVGNAIVLSAHDKETGNTVKEIKILEPKEVNPITGQRLLKLDKSKPLDLSTLKVALVDDNGSQREVSYADFYKEGIEIKDRDTNKVLTNGLELTEDEKNQAIIAEITHTKSLRKTNFAIQFEVRSDDYIKKMEYSFDEGQTWETVENPVLDEKNSNNISYRQTIKLKKKYEGKKAKFKITSVKGKTYVYTCDSPIKDYGFKYSFGIPSKDIEENPNAHFALYITFVQEDKQEEKPGEEPGEDPGDDPGEDPGDDIGDDTGDDTIDPTQSREVGKEDIDATLEENYINYKKIKPITITKATDVTITKVEGLPEGLKYKDGKIEGTIESKDEFNSYKDYEFVIYANKADEAIKRKLKLTVYQDKDKDGVSAMDEGEDGDSKFDPIFTSTSRIIKKKIGETAPSIDDYKKLIKNLPDDGSVTLTILKQPNMQKAGNNMVRIKFKSSNVQNESIVTINVVVTNN